MYQLDISNKVLSVGDRVYYCGGSTDHRFGTLRFWAEMLQSFTVDFDDGTSGMLQGDKLTLIDDEFMATDEYARAVRAIKAKKQRTEAQ